MKGLKTIRMRLGMTQEKMGEVTGIAPNTLSRYERGALTPSADAVSKIAKALNVTTDELLNGPKEEKIKITLVWDRKDVEGEIDMNGSRFSLFLGDDGTVGIKGAAKFTSREALKEAAAEILKELEQGYDFQIQRGLIKAGE